MNAPRLGLLLLLAAVVGCEEPGYRDECTVRFRAARTATDTVAILDKPQGPRGIYCGAFLNMRPAK